MKKIGIETYLFGIPALMFIVLSLYFIARPLYGYTSTWDDGSTKYWKYSASDPYCGYPDTQAKRPTVTVHSVSDVYYRTFLAGGTGKATDVSVWKKRQGNCPYQVMDIYKSGVPLDLLIMAVAFGIGGYVSLGGRVRFSKSKDQV